MAIHSRALDSLNQINQIYGLDQIWRWTTIIISKYLELSPHWLSLRASPDNCYYSQDDPSHDRWLQWAMKIILFVWRQCGALTALLDHTSVKERWLLKTFIAGVKDSSCTVNILQLEVGQSYIVPKHMFIIDIEEFCARVKW